MRYILSLIVAAGSIAALATEPPKRIFNETDNQRAERMAWWRHDRFGMFIHFGLYAVPGRHEWVQSYEAVDTESYGKKYMPRFNPVVRHGQQGDLKPVGGLTLPMQKPNVSVPVIEMFL